MKKYELTNETMMWCGKILYRIRALTDIGDDVKSGDLGGWVENENNLSHNGDAWVYGDAQVCGDAWVYGDAQVCGDAQVYGNAWVYGNARVYGDAQVCGDAWVYGDAQVYGNAQVCGDAWVMKNADIHTTSDVLIIGPIGSRDGMTTFYRDKYNQIYVKCGCKNTDIDTWLKMVNETHGDNEHAQAYRLAAEIAKLQIKIGGDTDNEQV